MKILVNYAGTDNQNHVYSVTQQEFLQEVKEYAQRTFRDWTLTKERLPEEGRWVLARHYRDTWGASDGDSENRNVVAVRLVKGLSLLDRHRMNQGEIPDPEGRSKRYAIGDEWAGLNLVPYAWETTEDGHFYGQEVYCWMPIPTDPKLEKGARLTFNNEIERFVAGCPCCPACGNLITLDLIQKNIDDPKVFRYESKVGFILTPPNGEKSLSLNFTCDRCGSRFTSLLTSVSPESRPYVRVNNFLVEI